MKNDNRVRGTHRAIARPALGSASWIALAAASLTLGAGLLNAVPAAAADPDQGGQVDQIIVTAQKRSESLEKVPVSVQVVQGQALAQQNTNDLSDLTNTMPSVHVVNTGGPANTLNVRGIGSGQGNPAFDQSVAMFEDDIYHGRSHMITATFLDLDRIEVLKGPQSTFFGNNAIAGALNIVTKKPDDHSDGWVRALYGSYGAYALEGAAGGPLGDKLAVRVAGTINGDTGWIRNVDTGGMAPADQNYAGRFTAVWKPVEGFDATLKIEGSSNKINGATSDAVFQWTNCPAPAPLANGTATSFKGSVNKFCGAALAAGVPTGLNNNLDSGLAGQYALLTTNEDVLTLNYHRWGQTFTSVTGYSAYNFNANADGAHTGAVLQDTNIPETYHQFSQEFRITSPADQRVSYIAGVYYQSDTDNELIDGNATYLNPTLTALFPALAPYLPLNYSVAYGQREQIESIFGSVSWNITDQLKFNAGLRGSRDHKDFLGNLAYGTATQTYGGFVVLPNATLENDPSILLGKPGTYPLAQTNSAWMPSAGLQYQVTPAAMVYGTYTRGFKAGGFNGVDVANVSGVAGATTYGPEYVNAYEVGLKSKWFENRVLLNLDVFRMEYNGLQVNSLVQLGLNQDVEVKNAATSVSQGVELESQWVITDNFRLAADVTYLDARYVSYPNASPNFLQNQNKVKSQDLSGQPMDFAPTWSGSFHAEYRVNLPRDFRLTGSLSPFFETKYYNSNGTDDPLTLIPGHVRLDAMLTLDSPSRRWAVDLIGKNLTDAVIIIAQNANLGAKEEPLNVAVQARYKW